MAIPDFQTLMRPVLEMHSDGKEHATRDVVAAMSGRFELTEQERAELLASGRQTVIANRVHWAITYMAQAGVLERPRRAHSVITERGRRLLTEETGRIGIKVLDRFPEFLAFKARTRVRRSDGAEARQNDETPPAEAIPVLIAETHAVLAAELVSKLLKAPPEFFERCVLRLLVKMGYGGPEGASEHLGGPGDKGFDGLVRKDPLGFDVVYMQAKRYSADHTVGSQEVQAFVGALHGRQADRGVFITTSSFSRSAVEYVRSVSTRVVLIDGQKLGELMVEYGCGVRESETIVIKELDEDFFDVA